MMSSIGSASSNSAYLSKMLGRMDSDSSGSISKDEFISGRPKGASADQSATLFDALDSSQSGAMSVSDMASAFQQMSSLMQATMLQAQEASATQAQAGQRGPDAAGMFTKLDSDGDGAITKDEFLAGKPDDVSDEQAASLWSQISGDNGDSLTQEQFVSGMQSAEQSRQAGRSGPPPGPPPGGGSGGEQDASEEFDALDTNKDGVVSQAEFLAGKPDDVSDAQANTLWGQIAGDNGDSLTKEQFVSGMEANKPQANATTTASESANQLIDQLMAAINTYRSASQSKTTASTLSVAA